MSRKEKDDYVIPFKGAKLNRSQANRIGFAIICGFVAVIVLVPTIGETTPLLTKVLVISAFVLGFMLYGRRQNSK